jgi:hypothetical protein
MPKVELVRSHRTGFDHFFVDSVEISLITVKIVGKLLIINSSQFGGISEIETAETLRITYFTKLKIVLLNYLLFMESSL